MKTIPLGTLSEAMCFHTLREDATNAFEFAS